MTGAGKLSRRALLTAAAATAVAGCAPRGSKLRLRVATDVNTHHVLTATFTAFLQRVSAAFPDRLEIELFHSGQLYYDRDMPRALMRGDLDMAAPTITTLSRIIPDCSLTALPAFYGRDADASYRVAEGPVGAAVRAKLERKLGVVSAGRYVDLGPVDLFYTRSADATRPVAGRKIRISSGAANVLRLRALGAYPVMLPFADVPMALAQGTVDAIESTAATVSTGQLWDTGLSVCVRQQSMFLQYVPLINARFWSAAPDDLRQGMLAMWHDVATAARAEAARRQADARAACVANGIAMILPDAAVAAATRNRLLALSPRFVERLGIDSALAQRAVALAS